MLYRLIQKPMIIKVCGMREPQNIAELERLGIDMMGFIFYPQSSRYAGDRPPVETAPGIKRVGVFVNETPQRIAEVVRDYHLDVVQLHGSETPQFCESLKASGYVVIKVISVSVAADLVAAQDYHTHVDYVLFDTRCIGYGGSGTQFDWGILANYRGETPFLLSGGISPESAQALLDFKHPGFAGIDLNSRFEIAPALKDIAVLESFIQKFKKSIQ